jgi:hypothetical protein
MADKATIEIRGLDERIRQLGEASTKNPMMRKRINDVIRATLAKVRKSLQNNAQSGVQMQSDRRKAYKAVRMAVYRRIFGGQVNILQKRKAGEGRYYEPPRHPSQSGRGGNRAKQSERTRKMMSYQGSERGFILRFLNAGTADRAIHSMGNRSLNRGSVSILATKSIGGNRGSIAARNWFGPRSQAEMENAAANIDKMIDDILAGIFY